jgi:hypothetical protein
MTTIALTPEQRLLVLDAWRRSGLPAGDFAPLVGVSKHTLYAWKHKFDLEGPAGLLDHPRDHPVLGPGLEGPVAPQPPLTAVTHANQGEPGMVPGSLFPHHPSPFPKGDLTMFNWIPRERSGTPRTTDLR